MSEFNEGFTLWLTGLSGTGKSTLARELAEFLRLNDFKVVVLDIDQLWEDEPQRQFNMSQETRAGLLHSYGVLAGILARQGLVVIVAAFNPLRQLRKEIRLHHGAPFILVCLEAATHVLIQRDVKGQYERFLQTPKNPLADLEGNHEKPREPDLLIDTDETSVADSLRKIIQDLNDVLALKLPPPEGALQHMNKRLAPQDFSNAMNQ